MTNSAKNQTHLLASIIRCLVMVRFLDRDPKAKNAVPNGWA